MSDDLARPPTVAAVSEERAPPSTLFALLKISVPGFWIIYSTPFVFGYLAVGTFEPARFLFGVLVVWGCVACVAILNEYTDRVEDRVNQPQRAALAAHVGYGRLRAVVWGLVAVGIVALAYVFAYVGPILGAVCVVGGAVGLLYSIGPRFKRHGLAAQLLIPVGVVVPYLFGWRLGGGAWDEVSGVVLLLYYVYFAFSNIKNLPDTRGDAVIGLRSVFSRDRWLVRLLFVSPHLLILALVLAGVLPSRFLWALVLFPGALLLLDLVTRARTPTEKNCVYQVGFLYAHTLLTLLLVLDDLTTTTVLVGVVLVAARVLVTVLRLDRRILPTDPPALKTATTLLRAAARSAIPRGRVLDGR